MERRHTLTFLLAMRAMLTKVSCLRSLRRSQSCIPNRSEWGSHLTVTLRGRSTLIRVISARDMYPKERDIYERQVEADSDV